MKKENKFPKLLGLSLLFWACAMPAWGADFEFRGKIEPKDLTSHLLAFYVEKFTPEELRLTVAGQPDATGKFTDLYMDLTGVKIEDVRLDRLTFRMYSPQFNAPENWATGDVQCENALQIYALGAILESDINKSLEAKTFGNGDDHWRDVSLAITPQGLRGKGYYMAQVLFMTLDILIEIDSGLKIVGAKELWLDKPEVRVNRLDLPDYVTKKALSQIQPLLDLNRFPLPLNLHKVTLEKGRAILSTRTLPKPLDKGVTYHYTSSQADR
ncbi:MAG: DUF2993 domain-containing protein [Synergistaceae bacterium]|nr:DUF2993 domain-containing protein [Synergistaceae bacterium]